MSIFCLYLAKTCILLITQGVIFGEMHYVNLAILVLLFLDVCILCQTPVCSSSHMCFHHITLRDNIMKRVLFGCWRCCDLIPHQSPVSSSQQIS